MAARRELRARGLGGRKRKAGDGGYKKREKKLSASKKKFFRLNHLKPKDFFFLRQMIFFFYDLSFFSLSAVLESRAEFSFHEENFFSMVELFFLCLIVMRDF